jgi:hypothetical protein
VAEPPALDALGKSMQAFTRITSQGRMTRASMRLRQV